MAHAEALVQVFAGSGIPFKASSWPLPEIEAEELLVEIELATICGSDLHTFAGMRQEETPAILGHEAVGKVVRAGSGHTSLQPGDRITWSIADSCGRCLSCQEYKLPQKCHALFKYGHAATSNGTGFNGCYASHIVVRGGTHVVKIPEAMPAEVAAPVNCALATVVNLASSLPETCQTVVIQGAGLLGLYACAWLNERGVNTIFCIDVNESRLSLVPQFGGIPVDGREEYYPDARQKILEHAPDGVDAVLEVAGVASLIPEGIRLLRNGGFYGLAGLVHPNSQLSLTGEQIIRKCLTMYGVHNYAPGHLDEAVQFLEKTADRYPYKSLVSPPFPLNRLNDAFAEAEKQQWCRVAVRP